MDDVKLYATNGQLRKLLSTVAIFPKDIKLEFGIDKYKTLTVIRGKL